VRYDARAEYCQRDGARLVSGGDAAPDPYLGRVLLDQFRIEEILGAGGMGTVYRARQPSLDRDVAIKILHADLAHHADAVRRFQREARVATALDHPNVVRVLLLGQLPDGSLYLVMEHVPGRSLGDLLREEGPLPLERAMHIAVQVADAVGEAHAHGVVHRDVKPENVMIVRRGTDPDFVKVLDFGIARLLWDEHTVATQSGVIFGTARYISPEGASGEPTDARSDVYSIGVLAYQLVTGVTPFDGNSPVTLLLQHVNEAAPDIRGRAPCPDPIADVIMKALRKRPKERFDDASTLGDALREAALQSRLSLATFPPVGSWAPAPPPAAAASASLASGSLASAPSPFRGTTTGGAEAGVRSPQRLGPTAILLLAFILGAGAVTAGGLLVGWLLRGGGPEPAAQAPADDPAPTSRGSDATEGPDPRDGDGRADPAGARRGPAADRTPDRKDREDRAAAPTPRAETTPSRRRARRRAPPVTTIHPGRAPWDRPVFAPAVDEVDEVDEMDGAGAADTFATEDPPSPDPEPTDGDPGSQGPQADPAPPGDEPDREPAPPPSSDEPPPPWTGTLL
jgi:serine/threonine protein kinase